MWCLPTPEGMLLAVAGLKDGDQVCHELAGLGAVVGTEVAHIHIQRDAGVLWPGVDADVAFGQQHRGRHAARPAWRGRKTVQQAAYRAESCLAHGGFAGRAQLRGIGQPVQGTLAVGQIGGEVQALHGPRLCPVAECRGMLCHNEKGEPNGFALSDRERLPDVYL